MGLLSILGKGVKAMIDEALTPESFKIGEAFENFLRENIFIDKYYDLLERTHDYNTNSRDYVKSSMKPDFKFRDRWTKKEFFIEAKFRSGLYDGKIVWCNESQFQRYKQYNKELPVFILIGFGESSKKPNFIALLPLSAAKYTGLFPSYIEQFEIKNNKPLSSNDLWNR